MIDAILAKVFGTKNKREIKAIQPLIAAINDLEPRIQQLSDIDLAAKTIEFKEKLAQGTPLDDLLVEAFAVVREAWPPLPQHASLRRAVDRRHRPASRQNLRNANR
jgi:preprotein translocase subunit SecA